MLAIGRFKPHHHPQGMSVMVKSAMVGHRRMQSILARMTKRGVANIMGKAQGLGQILVQPQRPRNHPANLRHLKAVGQADAVMVTIGRHEHLRLVAQPAKGDGMDDAVAVALIRPSRPPRQRALDRKLAPARGIGIAGQRRAQNQWIRPALHMAAELIVTSSASGSFTRRTAVM